MVKSTKRCLREIIDQEQFSLDEMHAAVVEIKGIIDSRPISYLDSDYVEELLLRSHLLTGHWKLNLTDNLAYSEDDRDQEFAVSDGTLWKRARDLSSVLNHFWR